MLLKRLCYVNEFCRNAYLPSFNKHTNYSDLCTKNYLFFYFLRFKGL